ncbi:MAG TPA: hypothetical protein VGQ62_00660, partial [Chloroflexota bacterium]|nr:hypothetical protein [Chloroflexota bacterium]
SAAHVGAGVLLGMKLLDHLRYVLAPSRWPLMVSMWTGWIPEGYVKQFHAGWFSRVSQQTDAPAVAPTAAPARAAGTAGGGVS